MPLLRSYVYLIPQHLLSSSSLYSYFPSLYLSLPKELLNPLRAICPVASLTPFHPSPHSFSCFLLILHNTSPAASLTPAHPSSHTFSCFFQVLNHFRATCPVASITPDPPSSHSFSPFFFALQSRLPLRIAFPTLEIL